ncbi:Hypothetical predicted protein [Pelobates cultripes]|uniref:Uncharacterized protein n=1 Tax=Pelobates cultripes TaxID=61616 RepID=A0AAD1W7F7_PELCU|nr:Hypothetical predicted protein [Pelobates cultripes]
MSQHQAKKTAEAKDKTAFFAARTPQHKLADPQAQDGADPDEDAERDYTVNAAVTKMQTAVTEAKNDLKKGLTDLEARASHLEGNIESLTGAQIETEKRLSKLEEQLYNHETKIADAEDRSRRNNLRLRHVPEDVGAQDLTAYSVDVPSVTA